MSIINVEDAVAQKAKTIFEFLIGFAAVRAQFLLAGKALKKL